MKSSKGFTLIEILISAGLMGFMALIFITMSLQQGKQVTGLNQRLDVNEVKSQLMQTFGNPEVCSCHLNESLAADKPSADQPLSFDSSLEEADREIHINRVRAGCEGDSPVLFTKNKPLSSNLVIESIKMARLRPTRVADEWVGEWQVGFQRNDSGRNFKPVTVFQRLRVDIKEPQKARVRRCVGQSEAAVGLGVPSFDSGWAYLPWIGTDGDTKGRTSPDIGKWTQFEPRTGPPIRAALMVFKAFDNNSKLKGNPAEWRIQYAKRTVDVNRIPEAEMAPGGDYESWMKKVARGEYPPAPDKYITVLEDDPVSAGAGWLPGRVNDTGIRLAVPSTAPSADQIRIRIWAPKN